jgi:hypothetical protein
MHFNEMSAKARQFGLTFVAAALGLGVVLFSRGQEFSIAVPFLGGFKLHATVVIALASAFALYAVRLLDLNVYHRMLRGSVTFGEDFEQNYMKQIFDLEKGMTQAISHFSRYRDPDVADNNGKCRYVGSKKLSAERKILAFYRFSIGGLILLAVGLFFITSDLRHFRTQMSDVSDCPTNRPPGSVTGASETPPRPSVHAQ